MKVLQFLIFSFFMSGLFFATTSADTLYTWKDKDGVTHITKEPPPKNARQVDSMDYEPAADIDRPPPADEQLPQDLKQGDQEIEETGVTEGTDTASDDQVYDNDNQYRREQRKEERQQERLKKDERSGRQEPRESGNNSRQYYLEKRKRQQGSGNDMQSGPSANRSIGGRK